MLTQNPDAPLILVVEDDDCHAELIRRSLIAAHEEYRLEIAGTLLDAREAIAREIPSIVLTDYRLPDGDGKELVIMGNESWPVILMTSHGNEQVAVDVMKVGAQDYVVKSPEMFAAIPRIISLALREWKLIMQHRRDDESILRAKQEWELTFDAVPDLIFINDTQHTLIRVNRAMADRCGLKPEDLVGRKCFEVVHGLADPPSFCPHFSMMQDGLEHSEEIVEKNLKGVFDVSVSPLYGPVGQLVACVHVARDITERKKAEEERFNLEQQFQQTQKLESLGVLAGGIAHDFNNILTIILGHCFMVRDVIDSGMTGSDHLQQIEAAANRAADLCQQMLAYAGKSPVDRTRVNLWLLLDEMAKMLKSAINKSVAIELDLKRDVPEITGDNSQIQQIVMNLIINAAEAIGNNEGTIKIALKKTTFQAGDTETDFLGSAIFPGKYAYLEVSDTGCGMDHKTQKRIFEPFFTTKFAGRGLGMSAVLGIIRTHGGALQLSSEPGGGTTFKVYFPLPDASDAAGSIMPESPSHLVRGSGTILLVDDEEALRNIGSNLLKAMGFSVLTAASGHEALDIYRKSGDGIDLILLDLVMPGLGGEETYHELRRAAPTLPVLICSGYNIDTVPGEIMNDKHAGFIQKPYRPDQLQVVLLKLLEQKG